MPDNGPLPPPGLLPSGPLPPDEYRGISLNAISWFGAAITTIFALLRLYSRRFLTHGTFSLDSSSPLRSSILAVPHTVSVEGAPVRGLWC
jgi:hypothetical protein